MEAKVPNLSRESLIAGGLVLAFFIGIHSSPAAESSAPRDGEIVVRVINAAGAPQVGASVSLFRVDRFTRLSSVAKRDQVADSAGIVRFDRLEYGVEYKLSATTSDHLLGFLECAPTSEKPKVEINLRVSRPIGATIHIHNEAGKPIRNAFIFGLWGTGPNGMIGFETKDLPTFGLSSQRSDAEGNMPLPELPAGLTGFHLLHPDYAPVVFEEQRIEQGSVIDITMHDGVKVELDVNVQGGPLPKDGVKLFLDHESIHSPSTLIGILPDLPGDGKIRLTLAPGTCEAIYVSHPHYISTPEYFVPFKRFELRKDGNRFAFQFRPKFKVTGTLLDDETGKPAAGRLVGAQVDAGKAEGPFADFAMRWNDLEATATDDYGKYEIESPPGKIRINANVGKVIARPEFVEVEVAPDGTATIPNIFVRPLPNVKGVVLGPDNKPVPKAIVRFRDSDRVWDGPVLADSQGRFELSPEGNSTDLMTDKVKPMQTILAFDPYKPLGGEATVSFADSKSCANVELRLKAQSFDFPVEAFPTENQWYLQQLSPERRVERAAMTRPGKIPPELDGVVWLNTDKPAPSLADFRGRFVLLDFWTTWCGVCAHDRPRLDAAYELYKNKGLAVICVHDNSVPVDEIKKYVTEHQIHYPVVIDHEDGRILEAYKSLGVEGYPTYILIGPDGKTTGDPTQTCRGLYHFKFELLRQQLMSPPIGVAAKRSVN